MGIFSGIHRFHEAGERANENNVSEFGEPHHSLYASTALLSFTKHTDITDDNGNVTYSADSKILSLVDSTDITDAFGRHVAHIERAFFSLHQRHFVTMADGRRFDLSCELFHIISDIIKIEGLGWKLHGNIIGLNFRLYDYDGSIIAVIGQKMLSMHDKYCVDIYRPELEPAVVAVLITLQHMVRDRESSNSTYTTT